VILEAPMTTAAASVIEQPDFIGTFARSASELGVEMASIAGTLDDFGQMVRSQHEQLGGVNQTLADLVRSNEAILGAANETERDARQARATITDALGRTLALAESASRTAASVQQITQVLNQVTAAAADIGQISLQTRLVAFNASVEAGRAGEAGRGFAVIAEAVKDLSEKVQRSSHLIIGTLSELGSRIAQLQQEVRKNTGTSGTASGGDDIADAVARSIDTFDASFNSVQTKIGQICEAARAGLDDCAQAREVVSSVADHSLAAVNSITAAAAGSARLLTASEQLIVLTAESGSITDDTPYIDEVIDRAKKVGALFERALADREISLEALFDSHYQPIAHTQPQQHLTRFTVLTDQLLPPIQEAALAFSPQVVFCAAVDRNGYLPTHNRKFSQPQSEDPVWNAANCRNRRIFADRTGLSAGRNTQRFLLQTYRRDMGGGKFIIMKDVSAPISVNGRHWGGLRLAYRTD